MSSSADAVADVIAPPPRADAPRRAPDKSDGPSFEDHLKADDARPPREAPQARPRDRTDSNKESDDVSADAAPAERPCDTTDDKGDDDAAAAAAPQQQPAPPPVTTPILLQLLGAQDDAPPTADADIPSAKPTEAAAPAAPSPPEPQPLLPDMGAQKAQSEHTPTAAPIAAAAPAEKPAKTQQPHAKPEAPQASATPATAPADAAAAAAQTIDPTLAAAQVQLAAPQQASMPAARSNDAQTDKIELDGARARGDVKSEAVTPQPQARDAAPAPNAEPEMAAATQKALNSFKESLAAVSGERQDAAPTASSSTSSTPSPALAQPAATNSAPSAEHVAATRTAPVASQVGQEIVRRFSNKSTSFELRLDPPELGRVDVRLDVSRDHRVNAVITADSPQALTELARHARELEQTLQAAGLELGDNGLSFDLNQSRHGFGEAGDNTSNNARARAASSDTPEPAATAARPLGMESWRGVRIDVMA